MWNTALHLGVGIYPRISWRVKLPTTTATMAQIDVFEPTRVNQLRVATRYEMVVVDDQEADLRVDARKRCLLFLATSTTDKCGAWEPVCEVTDFDCNCLPVTHREQ